MALLVPAPKVSLITPVSPAYTVVAVPVFVLFTLLVEISDVALLIKPALVTVAVSPLIPSTQVFLNVKVALLRIFVKVHTIMSLFTGVKLKSVPAPEVTAVPPVPLLVQA